ncbi:MAG: sirohydrochlorin cobaltochelatase [Clostridiales bacterium]|nr:sirohydrochlorin cobaltochelatase [Clostridiales bacterium]
MSDISVLLVGHSSSSGGEYEGVKTFLSSLLGEDRVYLGFLSTAPLVADVIDSIKDKDVMVVPLLFAKGHHFTKDIKNGEGSVIKLLERNGHNVLFDDKGLLEYDEVKEAISKIILKSYSLN